MRLDDAYANAPYIPQADAYPPRWLEEAAAYRTQMLAEGRARLAVPYGPSARQAYDLFLPQGPSRGLCVFVHGGYWFKFGREYWSHFAQGAVARGYSVAMPSYDLCPDVQIATITTQIAAAMTQLAGAVDGPLTLVGHSAGGHLVARMAVPGVLPTAVLERVRHVLPISPVSDLRPLIETEMNALFRLTEALAEAESPALMAAPDVPVSVWVGAEERPVFLDQARWLADAWQAPLTIAPERHHFDVIDALRDPQSTMMDRICGAAEERG